MDLDPQCSLSFLAMGVEPYSQKVYEELIPTLKNLFDGYFNGTPVRPEDIILKKVVKSSPGKVFNHVDLVLSHQEMNLLDLRLARHQFTGQEESEIHLELEKLSIIRTFINQISNQYDYVFIDCPPNVNLATQNAFFASDYYVIPAIPDRLSTIGISLIRAQMDRFNEMFHPLCRRVNQPYTETKLAGIIFNKVYEYASTPKSSHREVMDHIRNELPDVTYEPYVTDGDGISLAAQFSLPVFAYRDLPKAQQNAAKQASYLDAVVTEFLQHVRKEVTT